jgi:flagellar hook-basal body complex protein FliE
MDAITGFRFRSSFPEVASPVAKPLGEIGTGGFTDTLADAMQQVESLRTDAQQQISSVLSGGGTELHSAAIAVEKADVAFQLMMQMRNKIVAAYQEVSHMQF